MKKAIFPIALLAIAAVAFIVSCKKTNNSQTAGTPNLNQLFSGLRTTPQGLSVTAGRDTMVFGTNGTMLHFYTNSFKDVNGNIITSGTVYLQLVEMYKPGDMIANRATTMSGSKLLQSGGQVYLTATMNGVAVYANKYGVGFKQAGISYQPMTLFVGNTGNGDSVVNWNVGDTSKHGAIAEAADSNEVISNGWGRPWVGYVFDSSSTLQYTNCDAFYDNPDSPKVSVNVIMPDATFSPTNTQVYIVLPSINCAMSTIEPQLGGSNWNAATKTITLVSESQTNIIPTGMSYKLVVIANKNGQYYYYEQSGTLPHNGLVANAALATDTQSDVLSRLAGL